MNTLVVAAALVFALTFAGGVVRALPLAAIRFAEDEGGLQEYVAYCERLGGSRYCPKDGFYATDQRADMNRAAGRVIPDSMANVGSPTRVALFCTVTMGLAVALRELGHYSRPTGKWVFAVASLLLGPIFAGIASFMLKSDFRAALVFYGGVGMATAYLGLIGERSLARASMIIAAVLLAAYFAFTNDSQSLKAYYGSGAAWLLQRLLAALRAVELMPFLAFLVKIWVPAPLASSAAEAGPA